MRTDMESASLQRPAWKWQVLSLFLLCGWGWVSGQIHYSVVEESELGTVVGNVAQDLGLKVEELPGRRLRLGSEESLRYFAVRLDSGALVVSQWLDRERLCGAAASCVLSVQVVTENPLQLFRLEVEILDLNDNSPSFPTAHRTLRIAESATVAARFPLESAQDPDVGTNAVSSYRLSPNSHFSLDVKQQPDGKLFPELVLERALDREEQPKVQLVLTAVDGGSPARSGTAQITVQVLDVNDNAPAFDHTTYRVKVPENTPVGAVLLQVNASDPDEGPNGETQYSFGVHTSDSVRRLFALDPRSGEVRVSGALDFEESRFYEIYVRAHDGGVPEMEGNCVLQVQVEDANDNPPEVLLTSLLNPVPEDTPPETVVGLFNVRDRDSGANGDVSLEISPDVPFAIRSLQNHFSLVTQKSLDRESTSQYAVELIAQDGGSPALTTTLTLLLNISDVNDNPPRFSQPSYDAFLQENNPPGSLLCTVSATDPDDGVNSRLVYSIESGQVQDAPISSFVHINPDNGNLYAQRTFDFELLQVLPVSVVVRDSGSPPLYANVTVYIFVLDQNDHPPTILHPASDSDVPAPQRVPLSAPPGYLVAKVTAVDADAGHNAWLSYRLLPQSTDPSLFHVSLYTGEVRTARAFQDSDMAVQQLVVLVTDNGDPPLSTTATITVALEEAPLEESFKPQDFLAGAKEKPDLTFYLIIALAAISTVALATVTLLAARCLRRRGRAAVSPYCCCWLSESPSRDFCKHSSPKLQLSSDGTLKYMEVTLRPTDSPSQCYSTCFSPGSERSDFTFLRPCPTPATLPRESGAFLPAAGTLRDRGQMGAASAERGPRRRGHRSPAGHPARMPRAGQARRSLGLPRVFSFCLFLHSSSAQIRYSIPEELTRGAFVGNIAKDLGTDVAKLAAANLQVLSDSDSQYFSVNVNTGVIMVSERIDREQLCGQNPRCFLHLKLAIENPVEFYRIEVEILDINDNPPEFPSDEVSLRIYELASLGARFPIQPAQDPDVGTNTLQTYHLSANDNFNLNVKARTDGGKFPELVLERALDREFRAFHYLVLTAEDGGSPPQSSKIRITIQVLDANDNHPVFDRPSYGARLVENSPLGTLVVKLNATDVDEGPNGDIRYSLSSHNSAALRQIFAIDEQTGEIRVQGNLDFEEATVYEIEVEAKDMGSPTMEEHCSVVVEITDVNDNAPEVILTSFSSTLSEDALPGTVVAVIHVRDRDSGEQGKVLCHVSPDLPFQLRKDYEHQYSLLTSTRLDREHVAYYNVTVSASDLGNPPLSRHTILPITLIDVNDNAPQFEQASYEVLVAENNPVGSVLVTVSAVDPDSEQNSRLSYSILRAGGTDPGLDPTRYLSIHPTNGQVTAKFPFDYEQTTYLQFHVEVSDGGSPALRNRTLVHVFVVDQNDNAPQVHFPRAGEDSATQFRISPSIVPPALITKVVAIDADSGRNAWLSYHLVQATDLGLFSVALRSGEVRIMRALQETDASEHELLVVVRDAGEPPLSTAVTLVVLVEEKGPEALQGSEAQATDGGGLPTITLYLIVSLVLISTVSLVALAALGIRCLRRGSAPANQGCCVESVNTLQPPPSHIFGHLHYEPKKGDTVMGVQVTATAPPAPRYRSCFSPVSDISEFMFVKPSADPTLCSEVSSGVWSPA
ncbi:protocadherin-16-like [Onychostruthus taczanowskii]|uniref:protocadherin-16-like n=1 Tax=Onychostruthus taczanowskii TaxID=356909 RepID=UPI001B8015B2|nr:protocadherin-16-like [Onychostruthus taczanowskii]